MTLDENVFNSACARFTSIDKKHSTRYMLANNTKTKHFADFLSTKYLAKAIPALKEEFGSNKDIDVVFSLTHSRIKKALPKAKRTNVQMDKNGNYRVQANMAFDLWVDAAEEAWVLAR